MVRIGEILLSKELITSAELKTALEEGRRTGEVLGKVLLRMKLISEEQLLKALAEQLDLQFIPSLKDISISSDAIKAISAKLVWYYKCMPLKLENKVLTIAVSDPLAVWAMEDLKLQLGFDIERILTTEEEILNTIRHYYGLGAETVEEILKDKEEAPKEKRRPTVVQHREVEDLEKAAEDASVIKLVNQILSEAIEFRATDIHIEPYRNRVKVRYRVDGVLYDIRIPEQIRQLHHAIVSRIKILSNLNVVERRLPQDGRAIVKIKKQQIDLRISIIPSLYGENIVIRILPAQLLFKLERIGCPPRDLKIIEEQMNKPHGIIFLTGPTGSGKTTTLYACLTQLNKESVKIITIEDPIEYELEGVTQIQVKPEIGLTFANTLRSILRHDPDIMMVGEVRDFETAELAIRTSLTGHLIFSTLHTNDAPSGITRLLDIGIEPYLVASSVNTFISQRLVRVICPHCKKKMEDRKLLPDIFKDIDVFYGEGCQECGSIGYRDRQAIFEILVIDDQIRELILKRVPATEIRNKAKESGFKTLFDAGVEKVKQGITTPEEVMRVVEI
ncbi:MAG: Flp pilus assembly complex ATPase component TadA [Candidatus Omnitrophica bacterium]|nr:Flp pilus assembly complex ATPase component TadA [Candidatus Omnitrophota bacterium]